MKKAKFCFFTTKCIREGLKIIKKVLPKSKEINFEDFKLDVGVKIAKNQVNTRTVPSKSMNKLFYSLTDDQCKQYEVIYWLTHPHGFRGTGRTHLMALAFIEHSLSLKTWVNIYDHTKSITHAQEIKNRTKNIIDTVPSLSLQCKKQGNNFEIKVTEKE